MQEDPGRRLAMLELAGLMLGQAPGGEGSRRLGEGPLGGGARAGNDGDGDATRATTTVTPNAAQLQ